MQCLQEEGLVWAPKHQKKMKNAEGDIKVWGCFADLEPGAKLKFF